MQGIYKITNKLTGEIYIGQSLDCQRRIAEHKKQRTQTIDNYINVLGVDSFSFEVIEEVPEQQELDEREQWYIQHFQSDKKGYNIQKGGYNNSIGEGNGRAILTTELVRKMRKAYNQHESAKDFYNTYCLTLGLTKGAFEAAWCGRSWSHVMPEVFTKENKYYYTTLQFKEKMALTPEQVLECRKYYVTHTYHEVWAKYKHLCKGKISKRTFTRILQGDIRPVSDYWDIPIYKKKQKKWFLHGQPVSTSCGAAT